MPTPSPQQRKTSDASTGDPVDGGTSLWRDAWLRMRKNTLAMISLWFVVLMLFLCFVFAWFCTPPNAIDLVNKFQGASAKHWLGTDQLGRDIFSRTLYGGQISLLVGFVSTAVAVIIGVTYGAVSGFIGGRTDSVMMRSVDTLFAIPFLVVVIVLREVISGWTSTGSGWVVENWGWSKDFTDRLANLIPLFVALGVFGWLTLGRIVRAQVMSLREQEFVEAARSLGLSNTRILFRHIIPNTLGPTVVYATLTVPGFILYEATLSYLGLGVEAPNSSWGILIRDGANLMETQPMLLLIPGLFFSLTLFALNFLGDGLRDALDVRSSKD